MATWLTSAWLSYTQRLKTCLEKLLKPYNAVASKKILLFGEIAGQRFGYKGKY